jgi:PAS domain S-box-containing protein
MKARDGKQLLQFLFTLLSVLLLSALAFFSFSIWQDVKSGQFHKLYQQNKILIDQSQAFFNQKTRLIVKTINAEALQDEPQQEKITEVFDYLLATTQETASYALLDTQGNPLLSRGELRNQTPEFNKDVIRKLLSTRTAQIGYQHRSGLLGQSYLPLYVPVLNAEKQPTAIVVVFFYIQGEHSIMQNFVAEEGHTIWFLGDKGKVRLTHPLPSGLVSNLFGWKLPEETAATVQQHLRQGRTHEGLALRINGQDVLANISYLAEYQLISINTLPASTTYILWLNRMQPVGIVFMLFLFIALIAYRFALKTHKKITDARNQAEGNVKKLSRAIEQSPNSVVITDSEWSIEYANKNFELSADKPSSNDEAPGHKIIEYPPYDMLASELDKIREEIEINGNWFSERQSEFDGKWYSFSISHITTQEEEITHYVTVVQDITERKHAEAELYKQANFDPLTGLPNRRKANEYLTTRLQDAWKNKKQVAVLYIDIDNFKTVNDTFGHQIGDQLLTLMG